jgi:hypothetical protein
MLCDMAMPTMDGSHAWIMAELDPDHNGSISFAEFVRWWRLLDARLCFVRYAEGDGGAVWDAAAAKFAGDGGVGKLVQKLKQVPTMKMSIGALQQLLQDMGFHAHKTTTDGVNSHSQHNIEAAAKHLLKKLGLDPSKIHEEGGKGKVQEEGGKGKVQESVVSFELFLPFLTRTMQEETRAKLKQLYRSDADEGGTASDEVHTDEHDEHDEILLEHHANESYLRLANVQMMSKLKFENKMSACLSLVSEKHGINLKELMEQCAVIIGGGQPEMNRANRASIVDEDKLVKRQSPEMTRVHASFRHANYPPPPPPPSLTPPHPPHPPLPPSSKLFQNVYCRRAKRGLRPSSESSISTGSMRPSSSQTHSSLR